MFRFGKNKKAEVLSHWYSLVPTFSMPTSEFYDSVLAELKNRQVPGLDVSRVEFAEGGLLSAKREYLRMMRERLVFDVCATPFGTAYFFSCRFAELPARLNLMYLLAVLFTCLVALSLIWTFVSLTDVIVVLLLRWLPSMRSAMPCP